MEEYHRLRFFHAYATQMNILNSLSSPSSLSQALTAASIQQPPPSAFGSSMNGAGLTAAALSRAWLSSTTPTTTDSSGESLNGGGVRSQSPPDQRQAAAASSSSSPGSSHQRHMTCPLCGLSLEAPDVSSHFYEEVHKMETFRSTLRFERLNPWGGKDMATSGSGAGGLPWPSNGDHHLSDHHHQQRSLGGGGGGGRSPHPYASDCVDSSSGGCKPRLRFPGDKMQPCSRWQTYQRVRQNRQSRLEAKRHQRDSFIGLLRCKSRMQQQRIDDKHLEKSSSTTSSPQASPTSVAVVVGINNNNSTNGCGAKVGANSRIWSIVGDMETSVRQDNAISSSRNWSPLRRLPDDKDRLLLAVSRDKSLDDLSHTILPDDHLQSSTKAADLEMEADEGRSFDERSDAGASSGNETSVDVEVEVI